jgi:broad specificity phosphatase PhoE
MVKVTIIRHAESKFNAGLCKNDDELRNCALTNNGKQQASKLNQNFDILVVSKLRRAIETYKNSNIGAEKVIFSHLVREQKEHHSLNFLEGEDIIPETPNELKQRAQAAKEFIKTLDSDNIGIISHYSFIACFLAECGQPKHFLHNTGAITFELDL